jgi:hypothetical protein
MGKRRLWCAVLLAFALMTGAFAADRGEARFQMASAGEAVAELTLSAPGASWDKPGAEGALATLSVDGQYNQDILVVRGEQPAKFKVFLGPLAAGSHTLSVARNARWSATNAGLNVVEVRASASDVSGEEARALAHAPIVYARVDTIGRFSDAPLLVWYERFPEASGETIQYSIIYTNEDSGTPIDALMSRWGRGTDIEYVYRVTFDGSGKITDEIFQGPDHADLHFSGQKAGAHPYFTNVARNNIFFDAGTAAVQYRFVPIPFDLAHHSREEVMDQNAWTYSVMAQELMREGKIRNGQKASGPQIGDPRNYLYIELNADNRNCGAVAWVKLRNQPQWRSSHVGRLDYSVMRSGWFRTTIELPPNTTAQDIEAIGFEPVDLRDPRVPMAGPSPQSVLHAGGKAFLLDSQYRPGANLMADHAEVTLRPGEIYQFSVLHP